MFYLDAASYVHELEQGWWWTTISWSVQEACKSDDHRDDLLSMKWCNIYLYISDVVTCYFNLRTILVWENKLWQSAMMNELVTTSSAQSLDCQRHLIHRCLWFIHTLFSWHCSPEHPFSNHSFSATPTSQMHKGSLPVRIHWLDRWALNFMDHTMYLRSSILISNMITNRIKHLY